MKIVLSTDSMISAVRLKGAILRAVKGEGIPIFLSKPGAMSGQVIILMSYIIIRNSM